MEIGVVAGPWGMSFEEVLDAYRQAEQLGFPSSNSATTLRWARRATPSTRTSCLR